MSASVKLMARQIDEREFEIDKLEVRLVQRLTKKEEDGKQIKEKWKKIKKEIKKIRIKKEKEKNKKKVEGEVMICRCVK